MRFGKRVVISRSNKTGTENRVKWNVRCDCGHEFSCLTQDLTRTASKNTGCMLCVHKGPRPYLRKRPFEAAYNALCARTKHPVLITYEQYAAIAISQPGCHYCGAALSWHTVIQHSRHTKKQTGANLDRKDSSRGYEIDNVVPCCVRCNFGKNRFFTHDEWVKIGALIKEMRIQSKLEAEAGFNVS